MQTVASAPDPIPLGRPRKWEQKQVQIRTLEGEFSVTMWASGTDDGKCLTLFNKLPLNVLNYKTIEIMIKGYLFVFYIVVMMNYNYSTCNNHIKR